MEARLYRIKVGLLIPGAAEQQRDRDRVGPPSKGPGAAEVDNRYLELMQCGARDRAHGQSGLRAVSGKPASDPATIPELLAIQLGHRLGGSARVTRVIATVLRF